MLINHKRTWYLYILRINKFNNYSCIESNLLEKNLEVLSCFA